MREATRVAHATVAAFIRAAIQREDGTIPDPKTALPPGIYRDAALATLRIMRRHEKLGQGGVFTRERRTTKTPHAEADRE